MAKRKNRGGRTAARTTARTAVNGGAIMKGVAILLALLAIAYVITSLALGGEWNPTKWQGAAQKTEKPKDDEPTEPPATIVNYGEANGLKMLSASVPLSEYETYGVTPETAESVYTLSVSYDPAQTTYQQTDFTINFKNPNSEWATGKNVTDYATLQHEDNSKTAVLTVKQCFSEQIIVTASSKHYSKSATFTVDYLCTDLNLNITSVLGDPEEECSLISYSWVNGTLAPTIPCEANDFSEGGNIYLVIDMLSDNWVTIMASYGINVTRYCVDDSIPYAINGDSLNSVVGYLERMIVGGYSSLTAEQRENFKYGCSEFFANSTNGDTVFAMGYCYDRYYNGVYYSKVDTNDDMWAACENKNTWDVELQDYSYFEIPANGLLPNGNSHIVVG